MSEAKKLSDARLAEILIDARVNHPCGIDGEVCRRLGIGGEQCERVLKEFLNACPKTHRLRLIPNQGHALIHKKLAQKETVI